MFVLYETVIRTTGGTYRATVVAPSTIAVTLDGTNGVIDCILVAEHGDITSSPESLTTLLTSWIYEYARGLDIIATSVGRHRQHVGENVNIEPGPPQGTDHGLVNERHLIKDGETQPQRPRQASDEEFERCWV